MLMIAQSYLPHKVAGASTYYVASLDMVIDPGAQDFVTTAIGDARSVGADHFVLVVNKNGGDRKSTRLNSSHVRISYAVFCLKKKKNPYSPPRAFNRASRILYTLF